MAKSVNGANDVCDVFLDDGIMNCTCVCIYIYIYIYMGMIMYTVYHLISAGLVNKCKRGEKHTCCLKKEPLVLANLPEYCQKS